MLVLQQVHALSACICSGSFFITRCFAEVLQTFTCGPSLPHIVGCWSRFPESLYLGCKPRTQARHLSDGHLQDRQLQERIKRSQQSYSAPSRRHHRFAGNKLACRQQNKCTAGPTRHCTALARKQKWPVSQEVQPQVNVAWPPPPPRWQSTTLKQGRSHMALCPAIVASFSPSHAMM